MFVSFLERGRFITYDKIVKRQHLQCYIKQNYQLYISHINKRSDRVRFIYGVFYFCPPGYSFERISILLAIVDSGIFWVSVLKKSSCSYYHLKYHDLILITCASAVPWEAVILVSRSCVCLSVCLTVCVSVCLFAQKLESNDQKMMQVGVNVCYI